MPNEARHGGPAPFSSNGNAADHFVDRHVRDENGARLAFSDPWRRLTYAGLRDASAAFAGALRAAGIAREQRIALLLLDTIDFPIAFWGALRAGVGKRILDSAASSTARSRDRTPYLLRPHTERPVMHPVCRR